MLDTLTGRERQVLQLRFGLEDGRARTLEEVGREFNVTRERIRQIEAKALRKLRHPGAPASCATSWSRWHPGHGGDVGDRLIRGPFAIPSAALGG